jgi:HK97 family phage major capsid protein
VLLTETPEYRSAFAKGITDPQPKWNSEELRALEEFRAMNEGSPGSAGGYGVPVLIDPSIILTAGAASAPVLDICRIVTITTDAWRGVSSAGVTWSYDAEGSVVSDDSPTLAQPTVTVYSARGFIPFSVEVGMDYPGFADEMATLLSHGFLDLVASNTVTGSGSSQPRGIFTALAADSTAQVVTTTDGTLGAIDFQNVYKAVPERYRASATWLMHTQVENAVRAFPTSSNYGYFTVDLTKDGIGMLQGRPVRTTDYAPQFTGTTLAANIAVLGDFSNFVVAQRAGMTVELVPHLFDGTYSRPTGQRGWWAYARHGFDSVNNAAFKILVNT